MIRDRRAKIVATVGPASAAPAMLRQLFEAGIDTDRGRRIVGHDVIHDVGAVLFSFRSPENDHAGSSASLARLTAKSASMASWLRPWPSSIEARALATLRPR